LESSKRPFYLSFTDYLCPSQGIATKSYLCVTELFAS